MSGSGSGANIRLFTPSIFIVEDEAIIAQDVRLQLEAMGYRVSGTASSGEESVRRVEALQPDIVLMDVKIKGAIDGLQAAGEILTRFRIPVVFMSAYADPWSSGAHAEEGRLPWITKPFDSVELQSTLESLLLYGIRGSLIQETSPRVH